MSDKTLGCLLGGVAILVVAVVILSLFTKGCQQSVKHLQSDFVGLNRVVRMYSHDGHVLGEWRGKLNIEDKGGSYRFVTDDERVIQVTGSVVVEEVRP